MKKGTRILVILIPDAGCDLCKKMLFIKVEEQTIKVTQKDRERTGS